MKRSAADALPGAVRHLLFCPPSYPPEPGGSGRLFQDLARQWVMRGGRATVWTTDDNGRGERVEESGVGVRRFRRHRWAAGPLAGHALGGIARIAPARLGALIGFPHQASPALLRHFGSARARLEGPFDLLVGGVLPHTHVLTPALRCARRWNVPAIAVPLLHAGLLDEQPLRRVAGIGAAAALRLARCVVALTEVERAPLERLGVPPERIRVLGAAITDRTPGDAGGFRSRHGLREPYVLQAGALSADKGTLHLIAAHELWRRVDPAATLALVGRPEEDVRARLRSLGEDQRQRIVLHESPSDDAIASALAGARALAHPTRADSFSLLVLEAWRAGIPVIVAAAGGPGRFVRHDRDGLVVTPGDPAALAAALEDLSRDRDRAARLGAAGHERWRLEGRWESVFPRWARLFEEIMDGAR